MNIFNKIREIFGYQSQVTEMEIAPLVEETPVLETPVQEEPEVIHVPEELAVEEPVVPVVEEVKVKKSKKKYYPKKKKAKNA